MVIVALTVHLNKVKSVFFKVPNMTTIELISVVNSQDKN